MKAELLSVLRDADDYVSGQDLCEKFGVSRTAVWKGINQLKEAGYEIRYIGSYQGIERKLIENADTPVGIVSNNFHVYRGCRYAKYAGFKNPFPIAASCHPLLFPNYFVRECFAVWKLWVKKY